MSGKNIIVINGRQYDALTGLPCETLATSKVQTTNSAPQTQEGHSERSSSTPNHNRRSASRSATLKREYVKRPVGSHEKTAPRSRNQQAHITKSPAISKFAPHPVKTATSTPVRHTLVSDIQQTSPIVAAMQHRAASYPQRSERRASSPSELKENLITEKLQAISTSIPKQHKRPARKPLLRLPARMSSAMAACLAVMILGGYLTYINMPSVSVRVAAAQSGVNASFPTYTPAGYRFDGPVAYQDGSVTIAFSANGGNTNYQIEQQKSTWNSQAVLDNYVTPTTDDYDTNSSKGLTIYTYDSNAAWVNKGIFYTIKSSAPLRTDQVLHIAQSL